MSIPEQPSAGDKIFEAQTGYKDIQVKTHKYKDDPTPIVAGQGKAAEFFHNQTDKDHQKKYAKQAGRRLFDVLLRQVCH